ncbi:early endosome antigen 1-like [Diaphorina citri]|uniref:Early endosome antigen 1-like n=1 Tax=Diaphorina citri TaxID=121845 RepID=A0A1S4EFD6_DIACI|nr:early endosome antigen 1-like [Diaphorina citri]
MKAEMVQCQSDLSCSRTRVLALQAQVSSLQQDLTSHTSLLSKKEEEIDRLRQEMVKKESDLVATSSDLVATRHELEEVRSELKEKENLEKTDDRKLEVCEVSKELEVLRGELEEQKTATKQWKKDWYQSVKERNAAVAELKQAQTENEALKEKLTSLEQELKVSEEALATAQNSLDSKLREHQALSNTIESMQKEMEQSAVRVREMSGISEKYEKDRKTLLELKSAKERLELEVRGYKLDLESTRRELETNKDQTIELRAKVQKLTRDAGSTGELMRTLDKQLALAQSKLEKAEGELTTVREENKKLKVNPNTFLSSLEDLKSNYTERESKLRSANEIIGEYETKITALESTMTRSESYCKEMVEYLETLQKNNDILSHDNEQLRKERTEYITQLSNACSQNETLSKSNAALSHQLNDLETTVKSLEAFYKQKEVRLDTTVSQLLKLCEHQRHCYEESLKKKPNLLRKVFGSSQNKEFDSKELEAMLNQERSRAKDLAERLYLTKAELDTMLHRKTQRVSIQPCSNEENKENVPRGGNSKTQHAPKKTLSKESIGSNSSEGSSKALTRILNLDKHVDINTAMYLSEQCVILGTRDGLFSLHLNELGEAKSKPNQIGGVEMVHNITFIHQKHMALLIVGSNRSLQSANLRHLVTAAEMSSCASPTLDTSPILNLTKVTSVAISPCQNIVAIAQGSSLVVARWNNVDYDEMCRKDMGGGSIQSVTVISPHCIVYSTQNSGFVTFDPTTCRHRVFRKPFLVVFNPSCITIIQISEHTLKRKSMDSTRSSATQPDDRVIEVRKPKFLGETLCNKNVVLMSHGALQLLNPELVFSAESITLSDVTSQSGDELSLSALQYSMSR